MRRLTVRTVVVLAVLALLGAMPAVASASSRGVPLDDWAVAAKRDGRITRLGPMWHPVTHTYASAVRIFGETPYVRRYGSDGCAARWPEIGLRIVFADFGGQIACVDGGHVQGASVSGHRWHTGRNLRVGDGLERLRRLHPDAERRGPRTWWLVSAILPYGEPVRSPILSMGTKDGKVHRFELWIGGAGD